MLLVIIGIVLFIIAIREALKVDILWPVFLLFAAMCIVFGLAAPLGGYEEPMLQKEFELMPVYEGENIYAVSETDGTILVRHKKANECEEEINRTALFSYSNAELIVVEEGSQLVMKEYVKMPKKTIWSFALGQKKTERLFYIPEKNIQYLDVEYVR